MKVSWREPGQNWRFWRHWNVSLPENVEKWTFRCHVRPDPAKVRRNVFVCSVRSPRTPLDLFSFNLNYEKTSFCVKLDFSRFTNRSRARQSSPAPSAHSERTAHAWWKEPAVRVAVICNFSWLRCDGWQVCRPSQPPQTSHMWRPGRKKQLQEAKHLTTPENHENWSFRRLENRADHPLVQNYREL